MLFCHTNAILEITTATFAFSFAVSAQNRCSVGHMKQVLEAIEPAPHHFPSQIPLSALSTSSKRLKLGRKLIGTLFAPFLSKCSNR